LFLIDHHGHTFAYVNQAAICLIISAGEKSFCRFLFVFYWQNIDNCGGHCWQANDSSFYEECFGFVIHF
jgi:hypothetical protein